MPGAFPPSSSPAAPRRFPLPAAIAACLLAITIAAFAGVRANGFLLYDDDTYVTENPAAVNGLTAAGVRWAFTSFFGANWQPLAWLSHMLDVQLFGMRPGAHHLVNLGLHAANALALLALLRALTGALWPSAFAAALFAVHPLRVESVAWIAERKDLLAAFLALLAALAWVRAVRRDRAGRAVAAPLLFALALLAKATPVTLPLLLLLLDWWPLGRWSPTLGAPRGALPALARILPPARLWLEKLPFLALAAAASTVTALAQGRGHAFSPLSSLPVAARAANATLSAVRYLGKAIAPRGLAAFYPYPEQAPAWWVAASALALLALLTILALGGARRRPALAVGWLWYLGALVPVIGIVQVGSQALADRYTYLPLIGVGVALAWGASGLLDARPRLRLPAAVAGSLFVAALATATAARVAVWRDTATLFEDALRTTGPNWFAHTMLGVVRSREGRLEEAIAEYRAALAIRPGSYQALGNLGGALFSVGREEEGLAALRAAIAVNPDYAAARSNLGVVLLKLGQPDAAAREFAAVIRLAPGNPMAHASLGVALARLGRRGEAAAAYRRALTLNPALALASTGLRELGEEPPGGR